MTRRIIRNPATPFGSKADVAKAEEAENENKRSALAKGKLYTDRYPELFEMARKAALNENPRPLGRE